MSGVQCLRVFQSLPWVLFVGPSIRRHFGSSEFRLDLICLRGAMMIVFTLLLLAVVQAQNPPFGPLSSTGPTVQVILAGVESSIDPSVSRSDSPSASPVGMGIDMDNGGDGGDPPHPSGGDMAPIVWNASQDSYDDSCSNVTVQHVNRRRIPLNLSRSDIADADDTIYCVTGCHFAAYAQCCECGLWFCAYHLRSCPPSGTPCCYTCFYHVAYPPREAAADRIELAQGLAGSSTDHIASNPRRNHTAVVYPWEQSDSRSGSMSALHDSEDILSACDGSPVVVPATRDDTMEIDDVSGNEDE